MNSTNNKKRYIKEWLNHIDILNLLILTPNRALSNDVKRAIDNLKELMIAVANDKFKEVKK